MLTIPKELQQAVRASHGRPLRLTAPETHAEYVLLQADVYDQLHGLLDNETPLTPDERRAVLIQAGLRAGWDAPDLMLRVLGHFSATAMEQINACLKAALGIL